MNRKLILFHFFHPFRSWIQAHNFRAFALLISSIKFSISAVFSLRSSFSHYWFTHHQLVCLLILLQFHFLRHQIHQISLNNFLQIWKPILITSVSIYQFLIIWNLFTSKARIYYVNLIFLKIISHLFFLQLQNMVTI